MYVRALLLTPHPGFLRPPPPHLGRLSLRAAAAHRSVRNGPTSQRHTSKPASSAPPALPFAASCGLLH